MKVKRHLITPWTPHGPNMARWMPRFWIQPNFHPVVGSHSLQALLDVDGPAFQAPLALQAGRGWPRLSSLELRAFGPWQDIPPIFMHFSWPRTLRRRMNSQISAKFTEIFWESCSCHILNGISDIAPALHKSPLSPHKPHVITCDILWYHGGILGIQTAEEHFSFCTERFPFCIDATWKSCRLEAHSNLIFHI